MRIQAVGAAGGIDEHGLLQVAALGGGLELIAALVAERARIDVVPFRRAHPAEARQHHGGRLAGEQFGLGDRLRGLALHQRVRRASPYSSASLSSSSRTSFVSRALLFKMPCRSRRAPREFLLLLANFHLFEPREMAQLGLEYRLGLLVRELEALDQHRLRLILGAHDADHFVEVQVRDQQPSRMCRRAFDLRQAVVEPPRDRGLAELQPLQQQFLQPHDPRPAVQAITLRFTR
jgi:hypothetical protein